MSSHINDMEILWRLHLCLALEKIMEQLREKYLFELKIQYNYSGDYSCIVEVKPFPFRDRKLFLADPRWYGSGQPSFEICSTIYDEKAVSVATSEIKKLARYYNLHAKNSLSVTSPAEP
jgi:hypothetical protein